MSGKSLINGQRPQPLEQWHYECFRPPQGYAAPPRKPYCPPREADVVYLYDGDFEGFLCCVFESIAHKELPFAVWAPGQQTATLFETRQIETDPAHAARVFASFRAKLGQRTEHLLMNCFLSGNPEKERLLLRFLHMAYALGPTAALRLGDPVVAPLYQMQTHLAAEVEKLMGFVRFEEADGMLGAVIHPYNYVLPLLRGHFCARLPEERFLIYDATHQAALLYENHVATLTDLDAPLRLPPPNCKEQYYQQLWKQYYKTMEIQARHNPQCRRNHCPKRYWADMTELREEL